MNIQKKSSNDRNVIKLLPNIFINEQILLLKAIYQNCNFFIPKIIVVNDLFKLSLNSYAAKNTICVLFLTKKTQNYRHRNYCDE